MFTCNSFTPKSDQFQISPAASPETLHHTVWRTWLSIAYSDERWLYYQFSLPRLYTFPLGRLGECTFWTWEWNGSCPPPSKKLQHVIVFPFQSVLHCSRNSVAVHKMKVAPYPLWPDTSVAGRWTFGLPLDNGEFPKSTTEVPFFFCCCCEVWVATIYNWTTKGCLEKKKLRTHASRLNQWIYLTDLLVCNANIKI